MTTGYRAGDVAGQRHESVYHQLVHNVNVPEGCACDADQVSSSLGSRLLTHLKPEILGTNPGGGSLIPVAAMYSSSLTISLVSSFRGDAR